MLDLFRSKLLRLPYLLPLELSGIDEQANEYHYCSKNLSKNFRIAQTLKH